MERALTMANPTCWQLPRSSRSTLGGRETRGITEEEDGDVLAVRAAVLSSLLGIKDGHKALGWMKP